MLAEILTRECGSLQRLLQRSLHRTLHTSTKNLHTLTTNLSRKHIRNLAAKLPIGCHPRERVRELLCFAKENRMHLLAGRFFLRGGASNNSQHHLHA